METTVKLYSLSWRNAKAYLTAILFVFGNIALPQLCHLVQQGGLTWLPIYFFTLIAAYKYGWQVGLLTAVISPIANSLLFGMPAPTMVPIILTKSILLALAASWTAYRTKHVSLLLLLAVVLFYQIIGSTLEWITVGDFILGIQDIRIGLPGMCLQVIGGYLFIRYVLRK